MSAPIIEKNNAAHDPCINPSTRDVETLRLLFVDDYVDFLNMVRIVFRDVDCVLQTETQAMRALELAVDFKPHVIVSDLGMPCMDGYEFIRQLRQNTGMVPFKALALSGYDGEHRDKALLCGFDACLLKPVDFQILRETIDELCAELIIKTLPENHLDLRVDATELPDFPDA